MHSDETEPRDGAAPARPGVAASFGLLAALAAVVVLADRVLARWWRKNHPFADTKERIEGMKTTYRDRREIASEAAEVIGGLFAEISRATRELRGD